MTRSQTVIGITLLSLNPSQNDKPHGGFFPIDQCWGR